MYRRVKQAVGRRARAVLKRGGSAPAPQAVDANLAAVFDAGYYLESNPDLADTGVDPLAHYVMHGRGERRAPSPLFDPVWYLEKNEDVAGAGLDPLDHYLTSGGQEGRDPIRAGFSSAWYLDRYPEVAQRGLNPLLHFITEGAAAGNDPSPHFSTTWYLTHNADVAGSPINPLSHYLRHGIAEGRRPNGRGTNLVGGTGEDVEDSSSVPALIARRHPDLRPLRTIPGPDVPRINLVTDSVGADSLFGGVATAILLASLWADRTGRRLRIVTRHSAPDAAGLDGLFRTVGIRPERQPELAFIPTSPGDYLETGDEDLFLTTSWWTTTSVLRSVPAQRVVYILQEDERCFYPIGSQSLAATEAMNHPDLRVVVNTEQLRQHLIATGVPNLATTGTSFEPSFAAFLRPDRLLGTGRQRNLFFYARPHNPRNLFDMGVAALDAAIEQGHLPRERWRIHFVGRGVPPVDFSDGSRPVLHDALGWSEYRELLGRIDVGLSLMASPHPSYPPMDLAASGSVVVTNRWPGKSSFAGVSDRVVEAEPTVAGLTAALAEAAALADKIATAPFEPADTPSFATWTQNLAPVMDELARGFGDV
jgi:hypothetical protein